jgi:hypothetical protein
MNPFFVYLGISVILFLGLLAWGAYLDHCYFVDGAPGHRPVKPWPSNGLICVPPDGDKDDWRS